MSSPSILTDSVTVSDALRIGCGRGLDRTFAAEYDAQILAETALQERKVHFRREHLLPYSIIVVPEIIRSYLRTLAGGTFFLSSTGWPCGVWRYASAQASFRADSAAMLVRPFRVAMRSKAASQCS